MADLTTKGLGASLLRNKAAPNSVLQHPACPAAPTSLSSIISSRSAFETSSEPQTCPLSYAVVPASQVAIANDREPTPKPHRKTNSSGKSSSVKLAARTNRVNELVDRVLAETEDWTGERLFSTYSPSFDYALKIADEPIPFEISEKKATNSQNGNKNSEEQPLAESVQGGSQPQAPTITSVKEPTVEADEKDPDSNDASTANSRVRSVQSKPAIGKELPATEEHISQPSRPASGSTDFAKASFLVDADNVGGAEVASMASMIKADDSVSEISPVKCVGVDEVINTVLRACESMTREEFFLTYSTLGSPTSSSISATAGDSISTSSNSSMTEACTAKRRRIDKGAPAIEHSTRITNAKDQSGLIEENPENKPIQGIWVECVRCKKWRYLEDHADPSELDLEWYCALQPKHHHRLQVDAAAAAACSEPESIIPDVDESQFVYGEFSTGSIVLAKMYGYPEWPSMIDCDAKGSFAEYCPSTGEVLRYRVVFLDPNQPTTQVIPANRIRRFASVDEIKLERKHDKYRKRLQAAITEAEKALTLPIQERIYRYGYPYPADKA